MRTLVASSASESSAAVAALAGDISMLLLSRSVTDGRLPGERVPSSSKS